MSQRRAVFCARNPSVALHETPEVGLRLLRPGLLVGAGLLVARLVSCGQRKCARAGRVNGRRVSWIRQGVDLPEWLRCRQNSCLHFISFCVSSAGCILHSACFGFGSYCPTADGEACTEPRSLAALSTHAQTLIGVRLHLPKERRRKRRCPKAISLSCMLKRQVATCALRSPEL